MPGLFEIFYNSITIRNIKHSFKRLKSHFTETFIYLFFYKVITRIILDTLGNSVTITKCIIFVIRLFYLCIERIEKSKFHEPEK